MPPYITLNKWTDEGVKTVADMPKRMELAHRDRFGDTYKSVGAELKAFYFTFGHYDMIAIVEAPSDEAMAQAVLNVCRH